MGCCWIRRWRGIRFGFSGVAPHSSHAVDVNILGSIQKQKTLEKGLSATTEDSYKGKFFCSLRISKTNLHADSTIGRIRTSIDTFDQAGGTSKLSQPVFPEFSDWDALRHRPQTTNL